MGDNTGIQWSDRKEIGLECDHPCPEYLNGEPCRCAPKTYEELAEEGAGDEQS